jgi:hypothetical protein
MAILSMANPDNLRDASDNGQSFLLFPRQLISRFFDNNFSAIKITNLADNHVKQLESLPSLIREPLLSFAAEALVRL